jgi:uncharacterized protein YegL
MKALNLLLAAALLLPACKRDKKSPLLATPAGGTSSVTMSVRAMDLSQPPDVKAVLRVLNNSGTPLTDFKIGNFSVLEDGKPGIPFEVGPENDPVVSVAIVLDRSGTMQGTFTDFANAGATTLVNALSGNDRAALIEFESSARVVVPFTSDKGSLLSEINQPAEGGATAFFDGVVFAADALAAEAGLKIMIFLSDGDSDNASVNTAASMAAAIADTGITVYAIVVGASPNDTAQYTAITSPTGGQMFLSPAGTGLDAIFLSILNSAANQNLVYVKFRKRTIAEKYTIFLNYGDLTAKAEQKIKI